MKPRIMKRQAIVRPLCLASVAVALVGMMGTAQAFNIETGNQDVELSWSNTFRYNLGKRVQERNPVIANTANSDEGDYAFDKGKIVTNRLDWLTELDYNYAKRFGFRVTGAAWTDAAFHDDVRTNPIYATRGSYTGNQFSAYTKRFQKSGAEFLDALVFANGDIGDMPGTIKIGRQAVLWGEAVVLSTHSVSYAQAPSDGLKALTTPGVDAKETTMPVGQIVAMLSVTPRLTLSAQSFFEWRETRIAEGGTYLSGTDFVLRGPAGVSLAPGFFLTNKGIVKAPNTGEWGLNARWQPEWIDGTYGVYLRRFAEKGPTVSLRAVPGGSYSAVYPTGQSLIGVSMGKDLGGVSTGFELVYHRNQALVSTIQDGAAEGARGETVHVLANAIKQWGPTALWSSATLTAELGYSKLHKITSGEKYFNGCYKRAITDQGADTGCITNQNVQMFVRFGPNWTAVLPGWDIGASASLLYGLNGNSPIAGGGQEKAGQGGLGVTFTYNTLYDFSLNYNRYFATNQATAAGTIRVSNGSQIQDRGWVGFTFKGAF